MKKLFAPLSVVFAITIIGCAAVPRYVLPEQAAADEPELEDLEKPDKDAAVCTRKKPMVALTFDDGPGEYTDAILDLLEQHGGRATFFVLGELVEPWKDTVIRAVNNGNEIAGHTWSHIHLSFLNNQAIAESIRATSAVIEPITGVKQSFFRPPYGFINQRVVNVSAELGYAIVNWTIDTNDWRLLDADLVYKAIMSEVKEGSVILLHDVITTTAAAMERVIPSLIAEGFQLVTVSELLYHKYGKLRPGRVYGTPGIMR